MTRLRQCMILMAAALSAPASAELPDRGPPASSPPLDERLDFSVADWIATKSGQGTQRRWLLPDIDAHYEAPVRWQGVRIRGKKIKLRVPIG